MGTKVWCLQYIIVTFLEYRIYLVKHCTFKHLSGDLIDFESNIICECQTVTQFNELLY